MKNDARESFCSCFFFIRHGLQPHCTVLSPRYLAYFRGRVEKPKKMFFCGPHKKVVDVLEEDLVLFLVRSSFINSVYHVVFTCMIITLFMGDKSFATVIRLDQLQG